MNIRLLRPGEHGLTKPLYQQVFDEDDQRFVDYYYQEKTKDNQIFAAEDGGRICAMVQLNPFDVMWKGKKERLNYVVAVATLPEYRHQGLMRRLLEKSLKQLEEEKQPFTFLMPASAAIYQPFGFTFIQNQRRGRLCRRQERAVLRAAGLDPEEKIVPWPAHPCPERVNAWLEESSGLYTLRSGAYYTRLCREQQAQGGDVFVILEGSEAVGTFCTAREGAQTTLRELICCPGKEEQVRRALDAYGYGGVQVEGCLPGIDLEEEQEIHLYMARPVCLPTLLDGLCRKGKPGAEAKEWKFTVVDPILPENSGSYVIWQKENGLSWERRSLPEEKAIDIGELFGYLEELSPFAGGFLNETV